MGAWRPDMIKTARVGGMVAVLTGLILPVPVGAG